MSKERSGNSGCQLKTGYSGCGCVITVGLGLALFGASIGFGISARVPFTESNASIAGAVGSKDISKDALPSSVGSRIASNYDFINSSHTLTIGPAEGMSLFVIGEQEGSPAVDFFISSRRGKERLDK